MQITDIISLLLMLSFEGVYILKLVLLKQRDKINANVLAKGKKDASVRGVEIFVRVTSTIWLLVWVAEVLFNEKISSVIGLLFISACTTYTGLAITASGVVVFILAIVFMKSSWRVGIDKNTKTALITNGIYKFSRNPAFVGFNLMFTGVFITYANILTLFVTAINMLALHLLILQEEKHLLSLFGDDYAAYKKRVPRYFWVIFLNKKY